MPADQREQFGQRLREAAAKRGITRQVHLRKKWDVLYPGEPLSTANAAQWWNGKRIPYPRALSKLAAVVGVSPDQMRSWAGYAPDQGGDPPASGPWAAYLRDGLEARNWSPEVLAERAAIPVETVTDWLAELAVPPDAETAIKIARLLGRDGIKALRAAGRHDVAQFAESVRADAPGALIRYELDTIDEEPWLYWLHDEHERGTVSDDEYRVMREGFLRRKRESIQLMRLDYDNAKRRNAQTPDEPESDNGGNRAAL